MKTYKYTSKKWMVWLSAAGMLSLLFLSSCLKDNSGYYAVPVSYVSFIQASPNEPAIDLFLNSNKVNQAPIGYGTVVDYFRAYPGIRNASIFSPGSATKLFSDTVTLKADGTYSLFLTNTAAHASFLLLKDTLNKPATGKTSVRFVDVSPDFWHDWAEYSEACSHREKLQAQYARCQNNQSLSGTKTVCNLRNEEVTQLQAKLSEVEAEIVKLQAQKFTIQAELAIAQVRADEAAFKLAEDQRTQEEELRSFAQSRINLVRLELKDNVRSLVLRDLKHVLDRLDLCSL